MKTLRALALLSAAFFAPTTGAMAGNTGTVVGVVRDVETGKPLVQTQVYLSGLAEQLSTRTDTSGHFAFMTVFPEPALIYVVTPDYHLGCRRDFVGADETLSVNFSILSNHGLRYIDETRCGAHLLRPGVTADVYDIF